MLQRFVDSVLAVTKESVKTITYESLNNIVRLINGVSALLLAILPGKTSILEGLNGWELRQTFGGPRLPRWMEDGVSSFNQFIHELPGESDSSSSSDDDSSGKKRDRKDINSGSSSSQSSRVNRAKGFSKYAGLLLRCIIYIFSVLVFLVKFLLGVPVYLYSFSSRKLSKTSSSTSSKSNVRKMKRFRSLKDNVIPCATDRRSSIVEELHLAVEVCIETVFDIFHKTSHCILAPLDTFTRVKQRFSSQSDNNGDSSDEGSTTSFSMATLSDNDPSPVERKATINHSLDTDARTCKDVITELGYPYEAIQVVTSDGYILTLERIPRRDSRKVVYLQHGVLDSSMGWISNGVVGSPAFAAFDQGYDVFLGNFRGLVSREHINKNISSQKYWRYSVNEHGIEDIPAMLEKIHETKITELKSDINEESEKQPYKLSAICHSLGGAAILMHLITRRIEEKPHRLSRLILLSPAGFHHDATFRTTVMEYLFFLSAPILAHLIPAFYIPTRFFRMLMNKLARDLHNIPAFGGLVQTLMSYVVGGDSSNWVGVMGLPHYNTKNMPGVSFRVALHLAQMKRSGKFMMFDYGNEAENMEIYGSTKPLDLGESYNLIDVPVDLVAGRKDRVIPPSMVKEHYKLMKSSGVEVSFNEFEYAHLDFTFSHHEELLAYVMSRLNGSSSQKE